MKKFRFVLTGLMLKAVLLPTTIFAMADRPNADPNAPPPPKWVSWMPIIVMFAIFYMLLIRPQMRQKKDRQSMVDALKKGDRIITQGGVFATIVNVFPKTLEVKVSEETKVRILKTAVAEVLAENSEPNETEITTPV